MTLPFSLFEIRRSAITPQLLSTCSLRPVLYDVGLGLHLSPSSRLRTMPFIDRGLHKTILLSQFLPLQLDVQLFRGSLLSGGICAALPSITRRNSVAMMLLSIRMTALKKDVVTTLIAHHGTIRLCIVCCKHALICCGMSCTHDMMIYNILLNSSRGFPFN